MNGWSGCWAEAALGLSQMDGNIGVSNDVAS
jgi:hypothetical protein